MNIKNNQKFALSAGWISILLNIFLFAIKLWAGIISNSISIIADAWHTLTDSISSIIVIIGLKISVQPPDEEHPFGHGRAEIISSIIISVLLAIIGVFFIKESVIKIISREETLFGTFAIVITVLSIVVKELMAQYSFLVARKTGKKSIKADGWHHRSDAISSVIILIGIFVAKYIWWIDGALGFIVAIIIIHAAYQIFMETINSFLGENADDNLVREIEDITAKICDDKLFLHHIHIHNYGNHSELTFHIKFPGNKTIHEIDTIVHELKDKLRENLKLEATIEAESI